MINRKAVNKKFDLSPHHLLIKTKKILLKDFSSHPSYFIIFSDYNHIFNITITLRHYYFVNQPKIKLVRSSNIISKIDNDANLVMFELKLI